MMARTKRPPAPTQPASAYIIKAPDTNVERHTLAVIVSNEPGVLARVIGLFSGRGYNIESLTVAAVNEDESISRITVVTTGTPMIIEQIKDQLDRLVPVSDVHDLTAEGSFVERELALVKVIAKARSHERRESLRMAEIFGADVVDTTTRLLCLLHDGLALEGEGFHRPDAGSGEDGGRAQRRGCHCPWRTGAVKRAAGKGNLSISSIKGVRPCGSIMIVMPT